MNLKICEAAYWCSRQSAIFAISLTVLYVIHLWLYEVLYRDSSGELPSLAAISVAPHDMDTSQPQINHGTQTLSDNPATSQRIPIKKALSIAIQYHELSLYWEEPALELPNAHKDLAVIRELLMGLPPALTSSDYVSLTFSR